MKQVHVQMSEEELQLLRRVQEIVGGGRQRSAIVFGLREVIFNYEKGRAQDRAEIVRFKIPVTAPKPAETGEGE